MKKKIFSIPLLMVGMIFSTGLVACGGGGESKNPQSSQTAQETIKVTAADNKTTLILGEKVQLTASVEGVAWSIQGEGILTVDQAGMVTAVGEGRATVIAQKEGYKDGKLAINVKLEKIEVTAAGDKKTLLAGETVQLTANKEGVAWESSNTAVATVDSKGLVTAVAFGQATIKATKEGFEAGSIAINVTRPAATAVLHFEDAEHYSADGWWSTSTYGTERGPGATPVYEKSTASDGTCVAYFGAGDKETLTFTSNAAVKAELVVTMGSSTTAEDLSTVEKVKLNNKEISMAGRSYIPTDTQGNYTFEGVSLGEVDLVSGENVLVFEFLGSAPYLDDLQIYAASPATIAVKAAPAMQEIQVEKQEMSLEEGATEQIVSATKDLEYTSSKESVVTVDATGLVTAVSKGSATITVHKSGMKGVRIAVTVTEKLVEGEIRVEAETGTASDGEIAFRTPSANTSASGDITSTWPAGATLTMKFNSTNSGEMTLSMVARAGTPESAYSYVAVNLATDCEIAVNGTKLTLTETIDATVTSLTNYVLGNVNVKSGENTITVKAITVAPTIDFFKLVPIAK